MSRLASRTALVTGTASGIGLAVASRFAREGARVVIADRDADAARAAADRLSAELGEGTAYALTMDIASEPAVEAGWTPDVVVANAGVQLVHAPFSGTTMASTPSACQVALPPAGRARTRRPVWT